MLFRDKGWSPKKPEAIPPPATSVDTINPLVTSLVIVVPAIMEPVGDDTQMWSLERQGEREAWKEFVEQVLPDVPDNKYFTGRAFTSDSFCVEHFVENRKEFPLEELRQLLATYLKKLDLKSVELINADYTNFLHLSSNFVALRNNIQKVYEPMISAREDVLNVKNQLEQKRNALRARISELKDVKRKKRHVQQLLALSHEVSRTEDSLEKALMDRRKGGLVYERALEEVIIIQRVIKSCDSLDPKSSLILNLLSRIEKIRRVLHTHKQEPQNT